MKQGYVKGDWYVLCDRCGEKARQSECRMTWDKLFVHYPECFSPRHPQDFVRGKVDKQSVPISRPDIDNTPYSTTLSAAASKYDKTISVTSAAHFEDDDAIGIKLNGGETFWTFLNGDPSGIVVPLNDRLPEAVDSGNTVYSGQATGNFITTAITGDDL